MLEKTDAVGADAATKIDKKAAVEVCFYDLKMCVQTFFFADVFFSY